MPKDSKRKITLACTVCSIRNYHTPKPESQKMIRLSLNKFCRHCGAHTQHLETK